MLAAAYGSHDTHHSRAAHLPTVATVAIGRGRSLLKTLLAPLPPSLGDLPGFLDGNVRRRLPAVARGQVKLGHLIAGGVLGSNAAQLLSGVPDGANQCLEG
jgi:hypothetical protein